MALLDSCFADVCSLIILLFLLLEINVRLLKYILKYIKNSLKIMKKASHNLSVFSKKLFIERRC